MKKSNFNWQENQEEELPVSFLEHAENEKIHPLVAQILWQRGIQTTEQLEAFLYPSLEQLHDPFLLYDMEKAVERIRKAVENGEQILVYGDYDADGITSTTVMKEAIELVGGEVSYFLPNRFVDGYGPNLDVYKYYIETQGISLIITVDNGVAGHEAIAYATSLGIDVIVTDHHEIPPTLPNAYAIIHPKHPDGNYPFRELAGVGVAFKVATALLDEIPTEFLDMVAIGTIADLVSLTGENRALVSLGLQMIKNTERIGLEELIKIAGIEKSTFTEENIGFGIGPRLNALGRLGEASPGVELMTTFDEEESKELAEMIDKINEERKEIVNQITEEAVGMLSELPNSPVNVLAKEGWHEGVLGIVAGKIMQQTGKPTIVLTIKLDEKVAKGSARSVEALNIFEALSSRREIFTAFGGHHMAAGMTLSVENLEKLRETLEDYIVVNAIDMTQGASLTIDEKLLIEKVDIPFIEQLSVLAPFGTDNPKPTFEFDKVNVTETRAIGADGAHLKFQLKTDDATLDAIAFDFGKYQYEFSTFAENSFVGKLDINEWNGNKKPQLMVEDFAVEGIQVFDLRGKNSRKLIPFESGLFLLFHENSRKILPAQIAEEQIVMIDEADMTTSQDLVVVDVPNDLEGLRSFVDEGEYSRVYLLGYSKDEAYLNGVGSRDQFARLFKFIKQQKELDVRYKLKQIAQFLKIPQSLLIFMINVFSELEFVTIDNGVLTEVTHPQNRALTESSIYQERMVQIKSEEFLLLSDVETIREWLSGNRDNN
ncbi:MAG: single-stranded-DNA-specific exonuclease RecJ [Lactobacillales bacterium]|jgi:single-stranded-DNA-specific exonuclease|nr:single-stranded-DNA-specific exonuclease RecJ [Lactobacillales bacterium]